MRPLCNARRTVAPLAHKGRRLGGANQRFERRIRIDEVYQLRCIVIVVQGDANRRGQRIRRLLKGVQFSLIVLIGLGKLLLGFLGANEAD